MTKLTADTKSKLRVRSRLVHLARDNEISQGFISVPPFRGSTVLHPDVATLTEHRAVLRHLLDGDVDAATEALGAHLYAGQERTLKRLKVLAVLPEPDLPKYMQRIA